MPAVDKSIGQSAESIVNRIRYNWSPSPPSDAGNPPAVVTGNLDGSIRADNTGRDTAGQFAKGADIVSWFIRVNAEYAAALEYGFAARNLAPRPFIAPAVLAEQDDIGNTLALHFEGIWK
jgi:hypothetical protein